MNTLNKIISSILVIILGMAISQSYSEGPTIFSYYWPIQKDSKDKLHLLMDTPTIIDAPASECPNNIRDYWQKKGKTILVRVHPFKKGKTTLRTEDEIYKNLLENIQNYEGVSIDELVENKLSKNQKEMFLNALSHIRNEFSGKIIAIWAASDWHNENRDFLKITAEECTYFIPEIYLSEKIAKKDGYKAIGKKVENLISICPELKPKLIIGLGTYPDMDNDPASNFEIHLKRQLEYIGSEPLLRSLPGIALYAPVYLSYDLQKKLDDLIANKYLPNWKKQ